MAMASTTPLKPTLYTGTFIHTPTLGSMEVLENAAIVVDEKGVIVRVLKDLSQDELEGELAKEGEKGDIFEGSRGRGKWWFPGFVGESCPSFQKSVPEYWKNEGEKNSLFFQFVSLGLFCEIFILLFWVPNMSQDCHISLTGKHEYSSL